MCFGRRDTKLLLNYSGSLLLIVTMMLRGVSAWLQEGLWGSLSVCVHAPARVPALPAPRLEHQRSLPLRREDSARLLGPPLNSSWYWGIVELRGEENDFDVKN